MPEEIRDYFKKRYSELKGKAKTYGEIKTLIISEAREACFNDKLWGALLQAQLNKLLENDMGSLCV